MTGSEECGDELQASGNGVSGILDEATQSSLRDDPNRNLKDLAKRTGNVPPAGRGPSTEEMKRSQKVLVCAGCDVYFENKSNWEYCPQCAEDLTEVKKA